MVIYNECRVSYLISVGHSQEVIVKPSALPSLALQNFFAFQYFIEHVGDLGHSNKWEDSDV